MNDRTMTFSIGDQTEQEIRNILTLVYDALKEKGYHVDRRTGGHDIWEKTTTLSCVIPSHSREIEGGLAKRLAKEHGLNI